MEHLGDITKIHGYDVPLVDIVTGGSPCQDLSVAGKRAGLAGERSGLFMEQIRIIKEMRNESAKQLRLRGSDEYIRPRYMVWENVPGAFSSNNGEDFRAVLEETAKVAEGDACIPSLEGGQKWPTAGCIMGDGWSIAWRVHDAQFWGVPQRRKRIALVADFGGDTAPEILFERKSMSGDLETGREQREEIAGAAKISARESGKCLNGWDVQSKHIQPENGIAESLYAGECRYGGGESYVMQSQAVVYGISSYDSNAMKSNNPNSGIYEAETARTLDLNGGSPACNQGGMAVVQGFDAYNQQSTGNVTMSITGAATDSHHIPCVIEGNGSRPSHKGDGYSESETMYTLNSTEHHAVCVENHPADSRVQIKEDGIVQTLSGRMGTDGGNVPMVMEQETYQKVCGTVDCGIAKGTGNQLANQDMFVSNGAIVRRLTPMECERLQGYPDHWTDIGEWTDTKGKKHKDADSPRYKALGNSIALPFWGWMAKRMVKHLDKNHPTMASLFDGIGGFPLVYSRAGCEPIWASEIEEFPIAVTKIRFNSDPSSVKEGDCNE